MGQLEQITYQVGGSLSSQATSYMQRQADAELYQALRQGQLCYVLNARQMGKSSLLVKTRVRLQQAGYRCSVIDISNIGSENITPLQWYTGLIHDLWRGFKLMQQVQLSEWKAEVGEFSISQRLSYFIGEVLQQFPNEQLIIFVDEIDSILSLPFPVDDFFALIRYCYNQRAINPDYCRLNFALFGVATPSDLIRDRSRTPFNIGQSIELSGFSVSEAQPLAQGLRLEQGCSHAVLQAILDWTQGQPFLTQKLCQLVLEQGQQTVHGRLRIPAGNEAFWVDSLVRNRLLQHWETQDEPEHLRTIRHRLLSNVDKAGRLLGIYQQVLQASLPAGDSPPVLVDESPEQTALLLSGLVVRVGRHLQIKNRIYAQVFNLNWVAQQLSNLRPYSQLLQGWVSSGQIDKSRLLRGQALADAQQWAQGKQLSDIDYQYLAASVESDRAAVQQAMEAERLQAQLQQEKKTARLQRRFLGAVSAALLTAVGFGVFTLWQSRQIRLSEIGALTAAAEGSFDSHRQLEAIYQAVQAATSLQQVVAPPRELAEQVESMLQHLVDRSDVLNRFDIGTRIRALAVHPAGDLIAVVSADGRLTYWRPSGEPVTSAIVPGHPVNDVAFSPDGEHLAIAIENNTLQLWHWEGTLLKEFTNLPDNVRRLQFSPDGQRLVASVANRGARLLHTDGTVLAEYAHADRITFSPNGAFIAAITRPAGPPGREQFPPPRDVRLQPSATPRATGPELPAGGALRIVIFDNQGDPIRTFPVGLSPVFAIAISPDGSYLAIARIDGRIELWTPDGRQLKTFYGQSSKVRTLAFSPDGQRLAAADSNGAINLWQLDGSLLSTFLGHEAEIGQLAFSPTRKWLASASDDGSVRLWNLQRRLQQTLAAHTDAIHSLAFTPDGKQLFSLAVDRWMKVWRREQQATFEMSPTASFTARIAHYGIAISPNRQTIAKILPGNQVELMQADGTVLQKLNTGPVSGIAFSSDGQQLVTGGQEAILRIWQRQSEGRFSSEPSQVIETPGAPITRLAFSPKENLLAIGSTDHTVQLWRDGQSVTAPLTSHAAEITALSFSPDGAWLASGSADNTVKLWRPQGTLVHTLTGHRAEIRALAFSPDAQLLASASTDSTVRVWQPERPQPYVRTLSGHQGYLTSVTFSPDGNLIASAGVDRKIILWQVDEILQINSLDYVCQWIDNYLQHSPKVESADRQLCQ